MSGLNFVRRYRNLMKLENLSRVRDTFDDFRDIGGRFS